MSAQPKDSKRLLGWIAAGAVILATAASGLLSERGPRAENLVWLSAVQVSRLWQPGKLERLINHILRWRPVAKVFVRNKKLVLVDSRVIAFFDTGYAPLVESSLMLTNGEGETACILTSEEYKNTRQRLESPLSNVTTSMRLTSVEGTRCSFASGSGPAGTLFCGATLEVRPEIKHGQFRLLARGVSTAAALPSLGAAAGIYTNVFVSCRATLPNGGALVIRNEDRKRVPPVNYWVITVSAIDAKGNSIALAK